MNMITKAYQKFIQRKRVYCEANVCCMSYGMHIHMDKSGVIKLFCDKHSLSKPETKGATCKHQ